MNNIDTTLNERGSRYGKFVDNANMTQMFKDIMSKSPSYSLLTNCHKESLDMIFHKISRILNGDPNYSDSWIDIAGYAELARKENEKI